jgi:hypothetical protein
MLYEYKEGVRRRQLLAASATGTQFTCFTGTKVQILMQRATEAQREQARLAEAGRLREAAERQVDARMQREDAAGARCQQLQASLDGALQQMDLLFHRMRACGLDAGMSVLTKLLMHLLNLAKP